MILRILAAIVLLIIVGGIIAAYTAFQGFDRRDRRERRTNQTGDGHPGPHRRSGRDQLPLIGIMSEDMAGVVYRFGRSVGVITRGFYVRIPLVHVIDPVTVHEQVVEVPAAEILFADAPPVALDLSLTIAIPKPLVDCRFHVRVYGCVHQTGRTAVQTERYRTCVHRYRF